MEEETEHPAPTFNDAVLLELATELHRLATGLKRDLQRNAVLPGLSDLTAMRPLQAMLTEALSARVGRTQQELPEQDSAPAETYAPPGYL
jgi:hypothetical protein